jgi:prepilin-type N-terminal cleavage/methylation domain-containing protein
LKEYNKNLGQHGFTIVEIMVALSLIVLIFTLIPTSSPEKDHATMQEAVDNIDRAVRFSNNESILRNAIVRIRFDLGTEPVEYLVEYGEGADLILEESKDLSKLSIKERARELAKSKKMDSQFVRVDEFVNENNKLPEGVSVYSIATTYYKNMITDGNASIYFYPTGERDSSIIIFNNGFELGTLIIPPFEQRTDDDYFPFSESELANLNDSLENKAKEVFDKWRKQ